MLVLLKRSKRKLNGFQRDSMECFILGGPLALVGLLCIPLSSMGRRHPISIKNIEYRSKICVYCTQCIVEV